MGQVKTDCIHFIKWNFVSIAYSICDKYHKRLIDMGGNGCRKNCKHYEKAKIEITIKE